MLEFRNSSVWNSHQNVTKAVLEAISKAVNFPVGMKQDFNRGLKFPTSPPPYVTDEDDLDHFADCLRTYRCHNLSWPQGMTEKLYNMTWQELSWQIFTMFTYPSVQDNAQVGIGFLLREIWQVYI